MKIAEMTFTVDSRGNIRIPATVLSEMGLAPGDHVRVAYLTSDGVTNPFCEFMLLPELADEQELMGNDAIRISAQLMAQANIPADADLQIACLNGALLICRDTGLQPQGHTGRAPGSRGFGFYASPRSTAGIVAVEADDQHGPGRSRRR